MTNAVEQPRQPLTERVHERLREDILQARLGPGQMISEVELAARFGVSKTPVREALRLLAQDGWVTVIPRKGYMIRPLGLEDLREVFALREMIEPPLASEAAWRVATSEANTDIDRLVSAQASAKGDLESALLNAANFHIAIAELGGNSRGARIVSNLVDEMTRLHYLIPSLEAHIRSEEELAAHRRIAAAIAAGDQREAAKAMREHLRETDKILVHVLGTGRRRRA